MRLQDFPEDDGKRVWLAQDELDLLISKAPADHPEHAVALMLAGYAGLRRGELIQITPNQFNQAPRGWLRVPAEFTKADRYRETPIPTDLAAMVQGMGGEPDEPVVDVAGNTVRRWVKKAAGKCLDETNDPGWQHLSPHDLRRTWGGHLLWDRGVLPAVVMNWGGWEDWKTFRDHYLGEMSPAAADRERAKVYGESEPPEPIFEPTVELTPTSEYARG